MVIEEELNNRYLLVAKAKTEAIIKLMQCSSIEWVCLTQLRILSWCQVSEILIKIWIFEDANVSFETRLKEIYGAKDSAVKLNPKIIETWINETLLDAEHLNIPGVVLKPEHKNPISRYSIDRLTLTVIIWISLYDF